MARNRLHNFLLRRKRDARTHAQADSPHLLEEQPARGADETALWEQEYRQRLFDWAAAQVRAHFQESTWQAFWRTAVGGEEPAAVGTDLGMSVGAVYIARSRVSTRIREEIRTVEGESNVVDVHVRRLRSKVDDPFPTKLIHTVRGAGYVLEERR